MNTCREPAADNITCLQQASALLRRIDDSSYGHPGPGAIGSGIGPHLRHVLDHYELFLAGLPDRRINYDGRARDPRIESDRTFALQTIDDVCKRLAGLAALDADVPLAIRMDCGNSADPASWWSASSPKRELQFLLSHTVHHYALIAFMLQARGVAMDPDFGVAPSTLRHRKGPDACAR
jgi:hypothetical protein